MVLLRPEGGSGKPLTKWDKGAAKPDGTVRLGARKPQPAPHPGPPPVDFERLNAARRSTSPKRTPAVTGHGLDMVRKGLAEKWAAANAEQRRRYPGHEAEKKKILEMLAREAKRPPKSLAQLNKEIAEFEWSTSAPRWDDQKVDTSKVIDLRPFGKDFKKVMDYWREARQAQEKNKGNPEIILRPKVQRKGRGSGSRRR